MLFSLELQNMHNNTNSLTDYSFGRRATAAFCEVKLLLLSNEFSGFGEIVIEKGSLTAI